MSSRFAGVFRAFALVCVFFFGALGAAPLAWAAPTLPFVSITSNNPYSSTAATSGNIITLIFTADTTLDLTPTATIDAQPAVVSVDGSTTTPNTWLATYTLQSLDATGTIPFVISDYASTTEGITATGTPISATTDGSSVLFDSSAPALLWAKVTSGNQMTVQFSKPVLATTTDFSGLSVGGVGRNVTTISGSSTNTLVLGFDGSIATSDATGTVAVASTVIDVVGNAVTASSSVFVADGQVPGAPSTPTTTKTLIGAPLQAQGFAVEVPIAGTGAVAGDKVELLLDGTLFSPPVERPVLAPYDLVAGKVILSIGSGQLGADGLKDISARITDMAGNVGATSSPLVLTLDTIAPTTTVAAVTGGNQATITFSEAVTATTTNFSSFSVGGVSRSVTSLSGSGTNILTLSFSGATSSSSAVGTITIASSLTDLAGNPIVATTTVLADGQGPNATVSYSKNPAKSGDMVTITATFDEPVTDASPTIALSGAATLATTSMVKTDSTHYYYNYTVGAGNGTTTVSLGGTDAAGNVAHATPLSGSTFTIDNTAPAASVSFSKDPVKTGDWQTANITLSELLSSSTPLTLTITGADTLSSTAATTTDNVHYSLTYHVAGSGNGSAAVALAGATDLAGNVITATPSLGGSYAIDTTAPTASITFATSTARSGSSQTIVITTSEPIDASSTLRISLSGGNTLASTTATRSDSTHYTLTYTVSTGNGTTTALIGDATDIAGNVITPTPTSIGTFIVDNLPPTFTAPTDVAVEATSTLTYVAIGSVSNLSDATDLNPTISNNAPAGQLFSAGTTTVTWTATDFLGNATSSTQRIVVHDTTAPSVTPPATQTFEATGTSTTPTLVQATSTDAVDASPIITYSPHSFGLGTTTITWTATDASGNHSATTSLVVIRDTTAPTLSVPATQTFEATGTSTTPVITHATATDAVDASPIVTSNAPASYSIGTTVVTWTVTDASGNATSSTSLIKIQDTTPPVISLVGSSTMTIAAGNTFTDPGATANDTVDGTVAIFTNGSVDVNTLGTYVISYAGIDSHANAATTTRTVHVTDQTAPSIATSSNITAEATSPSGAVVTFSLPTATDNIDLSPIVSCSPSSGSTFALGTTSVTCTATDASSNAATSTFKVIVRDTTAPTLSVPATQVFEATGVHTSPTLLQATSTDAGDAAPIITSNAPASFLLGTTTVVWTATDSSGNVATGTSLVVIRDTTGPAITPPGSQTFEATGTSTTPVLVQATSTDAVDPSPSISYTPPSFGLGTTTVTWTATDSSGNHSATTSPVIVRDTTAPTFTAPGTIVTEATGTTTPVAIGTVSNVHDIVDPSPTVSNNTPASFGVGTTTVTWTVTDASGNASTSVQHVVIRDTTAPTLSVPSTQVFESTGTSTTPTLVQATATDIADASPVITSNAPAHFSLGTTTVTWTATDASGNTTTGTSLVVIHDTTAPVLTVPATQVFEAAGTSTTVILVQATATDTTDLSPVVTSNAPTSFSLGTTTITWTATDASGNHSATTSLVVIRDTTAPTVIPPSTQVFEATGTSTTPVITHATATDLIDASPVVTSNAPASFGLGTTTITWTATDVSGNHGTTTSLVVIRDTTASILSVPATQTFEATGVTTTPTLTQATATDLVDASPVITYAPSSFVLGTTTVVWTVTDASGNVATGTSLVVIHDSSAPSITAPATQIFEATGPSTTPVLVQATSSDLLGGTPAVTYGPHSFSLGTTTVIWTATDSVGNTATTSSLVVIRDTTAPTLTVPSTQIFEATGATTTPTLVLASSTDLVDASPVIMYAPHSFGLGTTTVTWAATDASGNTTTGTSLVVIRDTTAPTLSVPPTQTFEATGTSTTPTLTQATASDAVDATPIITSNAPASFSIGTTTIIWTATDSFGNTATGTSLVVMHDSTAPSITAPATQTFEATGTSTTPTLVLATSTDLVDGSPTVTYGPHSFGLGTTTVTWTATDSFGNQATTTSLVVIRDTTAPTLSVPGTQTFEATGTSTTPTLTQATSTDLVDGSPTVTYGPHSFGLGTTTVTWTATDSFGNITTGTSLVVITDTTAPILTVPPTQVFEATGTSTTPVLEQATSTDAVDAVPTIGSNAPASFSIGTTTIIWTATDSFGNTATGTSLVVIRDTTAPTLSVPPTQIFEATGTSTSPTLTQATSTDTVDAAPIIGSNAPASFGLGTTTVTWTATDSFGNTATGTSLVVIRDTTAPTLSVPPTQTFEATGTSTTPTLTQATASDAVDASPVVTSNAPASFGLGSMSITWTATDSFGNSATGTSLVVIQDTTAPVITITGSSTMVVAQGSVFTDPGATAHDLVDGTVTAFASSTVNTNVIGSYSVTYAAFDSHGNTSTVVRSVQVTDQTAPVIATTSDIIAEAASSAGVTVTFSMPLVTDNVDLGPPLWCNSASGSLFAIGTTTITCTSSDIAGNGATSTFNVIVRDTTAPTLTTPATQVFEATGPATLPAFVSATATDTVDAAPIVGNNAPASFSVGTTTINWAATDSFGNTATSSSLIIIQDTTAPVIVAHSDLSVSATSFTGAVVNFSLPTTTDLVDGVMTPICSAASGSLFAIGTTTISCSATDAHGNTATSSFMVTVTDFFPIAPLVTLNPAAPTIVVSAPTGFDTSVVVPDTVSAPVLDMSAITSVSGGSATASLGGALFVTASTSAGIFSLTLPAGTTIIGAPSWDGVIDLPTLASSPNDPQHPDRSTLTMYTSLEVGRTDQPLMLSHAARLLLPGQAGRLVGYSRIGTAFTPIGSTCTADSQAAADAQLGTSGASSCFINVGNDLVVWTNHFTTFSTYTVHNWPSESNGAPVGLLSSPAPVASSASNGAPVSFGGGGPFIPVVPILQLIPHFGTSTLATTTISAIASSTATTTTGIASTLRTASTTVASSTTVVSGKAHKAATPTVIHRSKFAPASAGAAPKAPSKNTSTPANHTMTDVWKLIKSWFW